LELQKSKEQVFLKVQERLTFALTIFLSRDLMPFFILVMNEREVNKEIYKWSLEWMRWLKEKNG
jgi:hypothetical protein